MHFSWYSRQPPCTPAPAPAPGTPASGTPLATTAPPPAPNKLDSNADLELRQFKVTDIQPLGRVADIQSC
jgi:hypothetical protein